MGSKAPPDGDGCRIAYVSDIHLRRGRSALLSDQVLDALDRAEPDIVLLGGDLIDHASELGALRRLLRCIGSVAPTFAVAGNHDVSVGLEATREAVEDAGSTWIQGRTVVVNHKARTISLSGIGGEPRSSCDISVLCTHNPRVWKRVRKQGFDLVLAGHLHGCQAVWFETAGRLFPGAFFYPHNYIRQKHGNSHLVVSMGCADLIPIRWGCPREIVLCIL